MVRICLIVVGLISSMAFGQREIYVRPGLISAGLTIAPSMMLNQGEANYYLSGHLIGRLDKNLSLRGETFYYVDGAEDTPFFNFSSRTFCGLQYHLSKGNFDSHIGFMPGFSVMQVNGNFDQDGEMPYHLTPSFAANIGVTYYVWKFFNFFANVTYINSSVREIGHRSGRADELMISAGLGLNINAVKAK